MNVEVLKPGESEHAPFKERYVSPFKFSFEKAVEEVC